MSMSKRSFQNTSSRSLTKVSLWLCALSLLWSVAATHGTGSNVHQRWGFSSGPDWRACARSPSNPDKRGDQCGPYDFEQGGRDLRY
jgi:hypothetical protein